MYNSLETVSNNTIKWNKEKGDNPLYGLNDFKQRLLHEVEEWCMENNFTW